MAYFASVWNYIDVASITIHIVTIVMWFTFGWNLAAQFSPAIHYDIYKNIEASSFNTNLRVPNQMVELVHLPGDETAGGLPADVHDAAAASTSS